MKGKMISQTVHAGATTYFLDIKESQAGKPFIGVEDSNPVDRPGELAGKEEGG